MRFLLFLFLFLYSCLIQAASKYMNCFLSPLLTVVAKNVAFFAGSLLAVLIALTIYDEDVLAVEHVLSSITLLGVCITICRYRLVSPSSFNTHRLFFKMIFNKTFIHNCHLIKKQLRNICTVCMKTYKHPKGIFPLWLNFKNNLYS